MELEKADIKPESSTPKIQKVVEHLRNRTNYEKYYSPKLVSIGPIHHGEANLKLGEKYKLMWASRYIKEIAETTAYNLHRKIADKIEDLKGLFAEDVLALTGESLNGFGSLEEKLSWMLLVDGCSLLYILFFANSWVFRVMGIKTDEVVLVRMDVLLLENQLPYLVLKLLWIWKFNEAQLMLIMQVFCVRHQLTDLSDDRAWSSIRDVMDIPIPHHLLDFMRNMILAKSSSKVEINLERRRMTTYKNIQDLRAVGIRLKSNRTQKLSDIDFVDGWFVAKLTLPLLIVDNTTAAFYLNLMAYEMCPDFENDYGICSFAFFMDSLIDHPEDVKELRSSGVLLNSLGSDEEVADLFNIICADLVPDMDIYEEVRYKMNNHYQNKCKTWLALGIHTYFSNPWAFIAFLAALFALVLTFIQTWFAIHPTR
ncbi:hypothetical protein TSUD_192300 [Trifolium subterraneum]|uniref:Uncharacterized protein n=1 Tax=Trifolium subterraneum TaxID=3900 RepID=A0A2Z6NWY6_TRISU|nr:hypothetical protein TSUD_192300 [Trifolium subterraneum]